MKKYIIKSEKSKAETRVCLFFVGEDKPEELKKILKKYNLEEPEINNLVEDILEEQRPNIINFDNFSIITLVIPTKKTIKTGKSFLQLSLILDSKNMVVVSNIKDPLIINAFDNLKKMSRFIGITSILSFIIDYVTEESMDLFDDFEDYLHKKEREIIEGKIDKRILIKMNNLKENLYLISKVMNGNLEVIKEILSRKVKYINLKYFSEHHEDRFLYFIDLINYHRELVQKNVETYLSLMSHKLNEQIFKLTILGSVLIIPSIITGLFGMNVKLPGLDFWGILFLCALSSLITYLLVK